MTASNRRISINEVKSVFDCVTKNKSPPKDLQFEIVLVGSNGLKLSPPSYEYKGETDSSKFLPSLSNYMDLINFSSLKINFRWTLCFIETR